MNKGFVPSESAEFSNVLAMQSLASFRNNRRRRDNTLSHQSSIYPSRPDDVEAFNTVSRLVSIAEDFAAEALRTHGRPLLRGSERMVSDAWGLLEARAERSWDERAAAFKRWLHINLGDCAAYADFRAFVQARNAIAHGLGRLTPRQRRGSDAASIVQSLRVAGVTVSGERIEVKDESVDRCCTVVVSFILWLDERLQISADQLTATT
jgi:hypothetical protein